MNVRNKALATIFAMFLLLTGFIVAGVAYNRYQEYKRAVDADFND